MKKITRRKKGLYFSANKKRTKKRNNSFAFFFFGVLGLIVLAIVSYVLFRSPFFKVNNVIIDLEEENWDLEMEIRKKVWDELKGNDYYLLNRDSILWTNTGNIEKSVKNNYSQASEVKIKKVYPGVLRVKISKRKPVAIWCLNTCYLIDKKGIAYEKVKVNENTTLPVFEENKNLTLNQDRQFQDSVFDEELNQDIKMSDKVGPVSTISFVNNLIPALEQKLGIQVKRILIPEKYAKEARLLTDQGYLIYIKNDVYSVKKTINIIKTLQDDQEFFTDSLFYIDLRVKGKATACDKGAECVHS